MLALIWDLAICLFVFAAVNYGIKQTPDVYSAKYSNQMKTDSDNQRLKTIETSHQEIYLRKLRERVEKYIRENLVSIARANNAGSEGLIAEEVCFINDNRALIFYSGGKNNDRYLAEIIFGEDNDQVEINRFILKIKNEADYSGGLYGAD